VAALRWAIAGPSPKAKPAMTKQSRLRHEGGGGKEGTDGMDLRKWKITGFVFDTQPNRYPARKKDD
jgi:hypothetical protein